MFSVPGNEAINLEFPIPSYLPQKKNVLCTCKVMKKGIWTLVVRLGFLVGLCHFLVEISRCFFSSIKKRGGYTKHWPFPTKYSNQQVMEFDLWEGPRTIIMICFGEWLELAIIDLGGKSLQLHMINMISNTGSMRPLGQLPFWSIPRSQISLPLNK